MGKKKAEFKNRVIKIRDGESLVLDVYGNKMTDMYLIEGPHCAHVTLVNSQLKRIRDGIDEYLKERGQ